MSVPESSSRRRSNPFSFALEVVGEFRAASWPSLRTVLTSSLVVVVSLAVLMLLVAGVDSVSIALVGRLVEATRGVSLPGAVTTFLLVAQVVSVVVVSVLALRGPAPAGGLAGVFGGGASDTASGQTPSERRLFRATLVAGVVFVLVTLDLTLLG